jgi:enamine deaminase RidA (YjgF/YER057c/UK114 family)
VIQALLPVTLQPGNISYASGVRAGRWVFATGRATMPDLDAAAPLHGLSRHKIEAQHVFANFARVLEAGGTERKNVVRIDQYYTGARAVDPYHEVRREFFAGQIPASTSNLHQKFLLAGQTMEVQLMAAVPAKGFEPVQHRPANLPVHATSGYSPVLTCGDFVFVAGQTEALKTEEGPLIEGAHAGRALWKGTPIKLEAEFVIQHKLKPALETIGNTLAEVVKAQVYLRDLEDVPAFNEVWAKHFGAAPPATSIITTSTPGFICEAGRIEINTISVRRGGATKKEAIDAGVPMPYAGQAQAIRAGDLLFARGLMAVNERGALAVPACKGATAEEPQMDHARAGRANLSKGWHFAANAVRIQQFHTDLAGFEVTWQAAGTSTCRGSTLPVSAIEVPALAVPGAVVMLDLWVHTSKEPQRAKFCKLALLARPFFSRPGLSAIADTPSWCLHRRRRHRRDCAWWRSTSLKWKVSVIIDNRVGAWAAWSARSGSPTRHPTGAISSPSRAPSACALRSTPRCRTPWTRISAASARWRARRAFLSLRPHTASSRCRI